MWFRELSAHGKSALERAMNLYEVDLQRIGAELFNSLPRLRDLLALDDRTRFLMADDIIHQLFDVDQFISVEQLEEIQRRADEMESDPSMGVSWEEVKAKVECRIAKKT